jgi:hypothetical protein
MLLRTDCTVDFSAAATGCAEIPQSEFAAPCGQYDLAPGMTQARCHPAGQLAAAATLAEPHHKWQLLPVPPPPLSPTRRLPAGYPQPMPPRHKSGVPPPLPVQLPATLQPRHQLVRPCLTTANTQVARLRHPAPITVAVSGSSLTAVPRRSSRPLGAYRSATRNPCPPRHKSGVPPPLRPYGCWFFVCKAIRR